MAPTRRGARNIEPLTRFETLKQDVQLGRDLPHLSNVFAKSPFTRSRISIFDFDNDWSISSQRHLILDYIHGEPTSNIPEILSTPSDQNLVHVVIIEDISSSLVRQLINLLDISPEVFEEHLLGSGWTESEDHPYPDSSLWNSKRANKSHFSIEWSRPYLSNCFGQLLSIDNRTLTTKDNDDPDQEDIEESSDVYSSSWEHLSNTWRKHLNFGMRSWTGNLRESNDITHQTTLAADERVTFWHGKYGTGSLLIVLTDCGFVSNSTISTNDIVDREVYWEVKYKRNKHGTLARSAARNQRLYEEAEGSTVANDSTIERPSTLYHSNGQTQLSAGSSIQDGDQVLLDTFPSETSHRDSATRLPTINENDIWTSIGTTRSLSRVDSNVSVPTVGSSPSVNTSVHEDIDLVDQMTQFSSTLVERRPKALRNVASRCPIEYMNVDQARDTGTFFTPLTSTREDLYQWISAIPSDDTISKTDCGPLACMFMIFHHDTIDFLQLVEKYLDEVINASDSEVEVEKNITMWRKMIYHIDQKLRRIQRSTSGFSSFLSNPLQRPQRGASTALENSSEEIISSIQETQRHLQKANLSITGSISVAESRRGISEAESVTRLTELAFIFVPLSFAASFFGMQVQELNPATTSIVGFVGLAVGVVVVSYAVRLVIRSQTTIKLKTNVTISIRQHSGLVEGQPIRTRDVLSWIWHRAVADNLHFVFGEDYYDSLIAFVIVFSGMVVMISVWTSSSLVSDMKVVISLAAIIMFVFLMILACNFNMASIRKYAKTLRRQRQRKKRRRAYRTQGAQP